MARLQSFLDVLNATVGDAVGRKLTSVFYGTLEKECSVQEVAAGVGYFGGEVELVFDSAGSVFLGWAENDGWDDHFSLAVQRVSTFNPNTLVRHSADNAPEWTSCLGRALLGAECRGWNSTPHLLVLRFESSAVVVADGHRADMGDGDDIIVRPLALTDLLPFPELLWVCGAKAA